MKFCLMLLFGFFTSSAFAQVGLNTSEPNVTLDIVSDSDGILTSQLMQDGILSNSNLEEVFFDIVNLLQSTSYTADSFLNNSQLISEIIRNKVVFSLAKGIAIEAYTFNSEKLSIELEEYINQQQNHMLNFSIICV